MIDFCPHPEIAMTKAEFDPMRHKAVYAVNYAKAFGEIVRGEVDKKVGYRWLIENDLWFMVYFIMQIPVANHPFWVNRCKDIQDGPASDTLDIWARYHGKALAIDTPVLTSEGWKRHGDLKKGDYVFHPHGYKVRVLGKTEVFKSIPCSRITFTDGYFIDASDNHEWRIINKIRRRIGGVEKRKIEFISQVLETISLKSGMDVGICVNPIEFSGDVPLPIPPYTFGAWLGDGNSSGGSITTAYVDKEILDNIISEGVRVSERKSSNKNSGMFSLNSGVRGKRNTGMTSILRQMSVKNNKHIPDIYKYSSIFQRMELLRGLMDTDGDINLRSTATFSNKSKRLAADVYEVASSLGFRPRRRWPVMTLPDGRKYPFCQVSFQAYKSDSPFKLKRKTERCFDGIRTRKNRRIIKAIEKIDKIPVSCIRVSGDGMYLAGEGLIPTHNSSIVTIGETIKYHLKHPAHCTCILAYARPLAKKFLESIKNVFETSATLKYCYPEVVWQKPEVEAPSWSLDGGLRLKGGSPSRKEATIEAFGLIEGQPTGRHYERVVFDDLETDDIRESPDMLEKVYSKFEMAGNLGTGKDGDITRIVGTYYSHFGPMVRIKDRKYEDGRPMYSLRLIPGSDNGQRDGTPVLVEPNTWEKLKTSQFFQSQQLCDPTPVSELKLDFKQLKSIESRFIPKNIYKFMVLDQAGGDETAKTSRDMWSYGVVGVKPCIDELGQSDVYLLDIEADKMSHAEGIDGVTRMYLRNGIINQLGVEKVGLSTTEIHITNALRAYGRRISLDAGNLVLLKPGGRSKEFRVESALQWPMNNGKLFYSTAIHNRYIQAIQEEMMKFPFFHVDILDMWAYVYDLIKTFHFVDYRDEEFFVPQEVEHHGMSAVTGY